MTERQNAQLVTCGIFYCRDSTDFSVSASNKFSCSLTGQCSEIGNKNIPLSVMGKLKKRHIGMKQTREPPILNFEDEPKNLTKKWRPATTKKTGRN